MISSIYATNISSYSCSLVARVFYSIHNCKIVCSIPGKALYSWTRHFSSHCSRLLSWQKWHVFERPFFVTRCVMLNLPKNYIQVTCICGVPSHFRVNFTSELFHWQRARPLSKFCYMEQLMYTCSGLN